MTTTTTNARDPLKLIGTTISEKYLVEAQVGEGGFAVVYRAQHLVWKRPVAIKVFRALGDVGEERRASLVDSFLQEGALLAELSERSAAIVQARDVGTITTPDGLWMPYMVLEWLEGATLEATLEAEKAKGSPLRSPEQAMTLLSPIAEALSLAHEKGIAHRDVKPANVFVLRDARTSGAGMKLLDFGIAKVVMDAQRDEGAFHQTGGQITSFTPAYGAPEQFSRSFGATGPWTDVYALALIFCEVISGRAAIPGDSLPELAYASCDKTKRPTPRALGIAVSDEVEAVLARALSVSPDERHRSAGEMWQALRSAVSAKGFAKTEAAPAGSLPVPAVPSTERRISPAARSELAPGTIDPATLTTGAPRGRSGLALAAAGIAAVVVLGGGAALVVGKKEPPRVAAPVPTAPVSATASAAKGPACPSGMVHVPGGHFYMGSDERDALPLERPAHQVTLGAYCIDETEVTAGDYKRCSDGGECRRARDNDWEGITDKERKTYDPLCNARDDARGNHPINCVDWSMAVKYCAWAKKRLPTEAEWEFAARGPDGRKYPWGDDDPTAERLNACGKECVAWGKSHGVDVKAMYGEDDGFATTAPVASFKNGRSRYGLYDVVGNVWEWTSDWYAPYTADEAKEPKGPPSGDRRVIRGGGWNGSEAAWVRPTFRYHDVPAKRSHGIGFRCAADPAP